VKNIIIALSFLCIINILGSSCKSKVEKPPIAEQTMISIIKDINIAEVYSQGLGDSVGNRFEKNYDSLAHFYTAILQHYHVSFEEFTEALKWYKERPNKIDSLYINVLTQYEKENSRYNKDSTQRTSDRNAMGIIKDNDTLTNTQEDTALTPTPSYLNIQPFEEDQQHDKSSLSQPQEIKKTPESTNLPKIKGEP
jgi:hypothetical protein